MLYIFRLEIGEKRKHILINQNLTIAVRTCANADGGDGNAFCNQLCQLCRDTFQNDGESACCLNCLCFFNQSACICLALALHLKAAEGIDRLRGQPDVCHNGNRCLCDCFNLGTNRRAALQLDSLTSAFLHQSASIHNSIINGGLVAHKGHITDHECIFCTSGNSSGVVNHILHGNGKGILIAEHNHTQRVAN